jgi:hypothetical protein
MSSTSGGSQSIQLCHQQVVSGFFVAALGSVTKFSYLLIGRSSIYTCALAALQGSN